MKILLYLVFCIVVIAISGILVSKYLEISDMRKKKIINIVFITITIISIILMIIFFFYFFNVLSKI